VTRNYPDGLKPYAVTVTIKHLSVVAAESFAAAERAAKDLAQTLTPGDVELGEWTVHTFTSAVVNHECHAHRVALGGKLRPLRVPRVRALVKGEIDDKA